jgi:RND family efflux transporter MFP subunit
VNVAGFLRLKFPLLLAVLAILLAWLALWARNQSGNAGVAANTAPAVTEHLPLVTVVQPVEKPALLTLTLPATVEAWEQATLYAKVSGYVQWIKVDKGDRVRKGQVLATLEIPEVDKQYESALAAVEQAKAEEERAQADVSLKQVTYQRLAAVRHSTPDVLAQQDVDAAHAAYEVAQGDAKLAKAKASTAQAEVGRLDALRQFAEITAPYHGVVTARFVDPGALIQQSTTSAGTPLVTIAGMDTVRVYFYVPEANASSISRGTMATVLLNAFPGKGFSGNIARFANAVDPQTRTMKTELDLHNPGHRILPGMYGAVELKLGAESKAVFVPAPSIHHDANGQPFVYGIEQDRIRKIPVDTGLSNGDVIEARGLRVSDTVVLSSTEGLQEGAAVRTVKAGS